MRDLAEGRPTAINLRNYFGKRENFGELRLVEIQEQPFAVLLNDERVFLPAVHARGPLGVPGSMRMWDFLYLDHPQHPLTLRVASGPENDLEPSAFEWSRQVVRIDFGDADLASALELALDEDCRVRVPGVSFEFDSDQLNPASGRALRSVAQVMRGHSEWKVTIEGHIDNVGSRQCNYDLSSRRAASGLRWR